MKKSRRKYGSGTLVTSWIELFHEACTKGYYEDHNNTFGVKSLLNEIYEDEYKNLDDLSEGLFLVSLSTSDFDEHVDEQVRDEQRQIIEKIVSLGANINIIINQYTPLFYAIGQSNVNVVNCLIAKKADVNQECYVSKWRVSVSPLEFSLREKWNGDIFESLLKTKQIDLEKNIQGGCILKLAINYTNVEAVGLLLKYGASPNSTVADESLLNEIIITTPQLIPIQSPQFEIVNLLLKYGANVDGNRQALRTPLHLAIMHDQINLVRLLLEKGADPNRPCFCNTTYYSNPDPAPTRTNTYEWVHPLLLAGSYNPNPNINLYTTAFRNNVNNMEIVDLLLDKGAKLTDQDDKSIIQIANDKNYITLANHLENYYQINGANVERVSNKFDLPPDVARYIKNYVRGSSPKTKTRGGKRKRKCKRSHRR